MSLLNLHIELQWMRPLLERLVTAVERIAGPVPLPPPQTRQSTLDDYSHITDTEYSRMEMEKEKFARANMIVPGSEAFMRGIEEYEKQILASYGDEAGKTLIAQLPWKRKQESLSDR